MKSVGGWVVLRRYALLSDQGTACPETVLVGNDYTAKTRALVEAELCTGKPNAPVAGTWTDVTDNEACQ
jgi:hypothetical protein